MGFFPSRPIQTFGFKTTTRGERWPYCWSTFSIEEMEIRCRLLNALERVIYCILHIYSTRTKRDGEKYPFTNSTFLFGSWPIFHFPSFVWMGTGDEHTAHQMHGKLFLILCPGAGHCVTMFVSSSPLSRQRCAYCNRRSHCADCRHVHCVSGDADGFYRRLHCHNVNTLSQCGAPGSSIHLTFSISFHKVFRSSQTTVSTAIVILMRIFLSLFRLVCVPGQQQQQQKMVTFMHSWTLHTNDVLFAYI